MTNFVVLEYHLAENLPSLLFQFQLFLHILLSQLDPELEEVVYFPSIHHTSLPYAIKQLIAHEVEVEKMRRDNPNDSETIVSKKDVSKSKNERESIKKLSEIK